MANMIWNILQNLKNLDSCNVHFALLILNQPILIEPQLFKSIWNRAIIRALVDGGSNRWLKFVKEKNLKDLKLPSFISGDFDSIKPETRAYFQARNVKFIHTPDQDETDFTKAVRCLADESKDKNFSIELLFALCENSGRLDQIIANINTALRSEKLLQNAPIIIFSSECLTWVLHPGKHTISIPEEFVKRQYPCGLVPIRGPTRVTTSGLKWNLRDDTTEFGGLMSTSNTYSETKVDVSCDRDLVYTTTYSETDQ